MLATSMRLQLFAVFLLLAVLGGMQAHAAGEPTGSMASARYSHSVARLADGRALVTGGHAVSGSLSSMLASAEIYDAATGTFTPATPMATARGEHASVGLADGRVLVLGGLGASGSLASAEIFDPAANAWSAASAMGVARRGAVALALPDGRVLVIGGDESAASVEVFDPATNAFSASGALTTPRQNFAAAVLADGRVLVAGGYNPTTFAYGSSAEIWNPATGTWSATGSMAWARGYATATALGNGMVLVTGGRSTGSYTSAVAAAELFDPATGTFSLGAALNVPRSHHGAALLGDGNVLVAGGISASTQQREASVERYNVAAGTWHAAGLAAEARTAHSVIGLASGDVLVTGGFSLAGSVLAGAELFDPFCVSSVPAITPATATFDMNGGSGAVSVAHLDGCFWRVTRATSSWFAITSGAQGYGNGSMTYTVAPNTTTTSGRGMTPLVADAPFYVSQTGNPCANATLSPTSQSFSASGGSGIVSLSTLSSCTWTVSGAPGWIAITSGGSGGANISYSVAANSGGARSATLTIAGRSFTVSQAGNPCLPAPTIAPASQSFGSVGGSATVTVTAPATCSWTVANKPAWITSVSGGSGNANVTITAASNAGGAMRTATITIAGNAYTVTQAADPCAGATVTPSSASHPYGGSAGAITVSAPAGCNWTLANKPTWITSTAAGSGDGTANYEVAANAGGARTATLTIAGRSFAVSQEANPCSAAATLSPTTVSVPAGSSSGSVSVTHAAGCAWAVTNVPAWITVGATSGSGSGTVEYTVAANSGAARSATLTIAARSFTVSQAADPCLVATSISPTSQSFATAGGSGTINVTHGATCSWSVSGVPAWITVTSGATGTGDGAVTYTVAANAGSARSATLNVAGRSFGVSQSGTASYCASRGNNATYEWIQQIAVAGVSRASGRNGGYADFTALAPVALSRASNTLTLSPGFSSGAYTEHWRVWIDMNQDALFTADELVYAGPGTSGSIATTFSVPWAALSGNTRMRVSMKYGGAPSPCESFTYGEVEDYTVTIN